MKRNKTIRAGAWLFLVLCLMLLSAVPLKAAAAADTGADGIGTENADVPEEDRAAKADPSGESNTSDNADNSDNTGDDVPAFTDYDGGSAENATFSDRIMRFFSDNCAELLSALTLVSSLAVALLFKKGLLPALSSALKSLAGGLSRGVDEMGKMGEKMSQDTDGAIRRFSEAVTPTLAAVEKIAARADVMARHTEELEKSLTQESDSRARMETVLRAQSELFYRFFMSVNLPQYQKDALGDAYEKMNRLLTSGGEQSHETAQSEPQ